MKRIQLYLSSSLLIVATSCRKEKLLMDRKKYSLRLPREAVEVLDYFPAC